MKKIFITSVLGPVTPGLIRALATATRELGGEWLSSRVIKLDNRLAALLKVAVDEDQEQNLREQLEKQFSQLRFDYDEAVVEDEHPVKTVELVVDCNDRPGLTRDIDDILANLELVVDNMEVNRVHVASIGNTVFTSKFSVGLPANVSRDSVIELLEGLSDDVRVHVA